MRVTLALLAAVVFSAATRADDVADAKSIIEKAVKAKGYKVGEKLPAIAWKDKGKFSGGGFDLDYTGEWTFQAPDKYRFDIVMDFGGMKISFTAIVNGTKAWQAAMGRVEAVEGDKLDYVLNQAYQLNVTTLLPLLADDGYKLATSPGKDVGGKETVGVKITRDKRSPITLYFDKSTYFLVKCETTVKDEFQGWKEVPEEVFYSDYKDAGGKKVFTKMKVVRTGKTMIDSTLSDQKMVEKVDAKLFEKP